DMGRVAARLPAAIARSLTEIRDSGRLNALQATERELSALETYIYGAVRSGRLDEQSASAYSCKLLKIRHRLRNRIKALRNRRDQLENMEPLT
ncbi:MAG: hypothetical protein PHQ23_17590, partial [Candidatus Wallbacteria bacterium]|nr:hypothetical protein [Candidatus Wallbacteria bacterium]